MEGLRPGEAEQVGKYRLLGRLGAGGMGHVYLGQSPSGRLVAVKVIRPELADDPAFRRRFAHEVSAARRVSGMFTAPVVDADPDAPQPWMVTAYVSGPSLAEAVASLGPLPVRSVLLLAAGLAEGLGAVHAAGLIHRDLKPSNVLLAGDGPRIIDFGISRAADFAALTRAGGVIGSPGFTSPEQAEGRQVGPASDVFSLGGVLAFAATGSPPFGEGEPSVLLYRVVRGHPAIETVPAELRPLIERCLARDPAARPSTDDLLAELGYPEPSEDWLTWLGGDSRDTGTGLTERNLSALPVGVAEAVAGAAAGDVANLVPRSAPAETASGEPLAAAPDPANPASQMSRSSGDGMHNALAFYTTPLPGTPSGHEHRSANGSSGPYERSSPNGSPGIYEDSTELVALLASGQFDDGSGYLPPNELGPDHRRRKRLALWLVATAMLAVVAVVVAIGLASHPKPGGRPASGGSSAHAQTPAGAHQSGQAGTSSQAPGAQSPQAQASSGASGPTPSPGVTPSTPAPSPSTSGGGRRPSSSPTPQPSTTRSRTRGTSPTTSTSPR